MLIDIISDTHFDSWFGFKEMPDKERIIGFWRTLKPKGSYLIVAGDIGHNILQNIHILKALKETFYKEIIITLGNHDCYLVGFKLFESIHSKIKKSLKLYQQNGIIVLDGTLVEIEGITFGGAMGWYNDAYVLKHHNNLLGMTQSNQFENLHDFINHLWQGDLDSKGTRLEHFDALYRKEYEKLKAVHQHCDVMVSHFNPSINMEFQTTGYARNPFTTFFCFDGEELAIKTSAKIWIYGHTHERKMYIWHNKKFVTSALGYKSEHYKGKITTREII